MKYFIVYLLIINSIGLFGMWSDKRRAKKRRYRIPEKTLFLLAVLGGGIGTWAGMYLFRHKTKHWYFVMGMPLICIVEYGLLLYYLMFRIGVK